MIRHLNPATYARTPWKNGGGTSTDIAWLREDDAVADPWSGVIWRYGRTRIETPGAFSHHPGLSRLIAVVEGKGLVLNVADGGSIDLRQPFTPGRFSGEQRVSSMLEAGPVGVVNLMGDAERARIDLVFAEPGSTTETTETTTIVHAIGGPAQLKVAGATLHLADDAALEIRDPKSLRVTIVSGRVAVASVGVTQG